MENPIDSEVVFTVRKAVSGKVEVTVSNTDARDRIFCGYLAKLLQLWLNRKVDKQS